VGQNLVDTIEQGFADPAERIVHAVRGAAPALGGGMDSVTVTVTLGKQFAISGRKLLNTPGERDTSVVMILVGHFSVSFNQEKIHIRTEVESLAYPAPDEVRHFPASYATRPCEEPTLPVKFTKFVPQHQGSLLVEVVGVVDIRYE
jgi:hypothetical protein